MGEKTNKRFLTILVESLFFNHLGWNLLNYLQTSQDKLLGTNTLAYLGAALVMKKRFTDHSSV